MICASVYLVAMVVVAINRQELAYQSLLGGVAALGLAVFAYWLCRSGHAQAGAVLIVCGGLLIGIYSGFVRGTMSVAAVMLIPAVLFAGVSLGSRAGFITGLVEIALYSALTYAQKLDIIQPNAPQLSALTGLVLIGANLVLVGLVSGQTVRSMESFLQRSNERGRDLATLAAEKDRLLAELQGREEAQRRLLETVHELGSPIIPLARGVIAMPLIGAIDSDRAQDITSNLLKGVAEYHARAVIIDITGVPLVDTAVAGALLQAAQGVRLLGAEPILTGIRSEVAQTIVGLGVDLSGITVRSTLQSGLEYAVAREGKEHSLGG
jgi:anti-anti-sigma regulatory factor